MMKKYFNNKNGNQKVVYGKGKGKKYSDVSRETENMFYAWLAYAGIEEDEFYKRISRKPCKIVENINTNGDIEINIFAGFSQVIVPLVWQKNGSSSLDDFLVNVLLIFSYVAARLEDKNFEKAVTVFADRMIEERKMTL